MHHLSSFFRGFGPGIQLREYYPINLPNVLQDFIGVSHVSYSIIANLKSKSFIRSF